MTTEPPPRPPSRRRLILAIVAGVLVLVIVIVVLVFALGGDDTGSSTTAGSSATQSSASASSTTKSTSSTTTTASTSTTSGSSSAATRVVVDGKEQNLSGSVSCFGALGRQTINIGLDMNILLNDASNPIEVTTVRLDKVEGGSLLYESVVGSGDATATKTGNTYKISGHENSGSTNRAFEIEVTCP